MILTTPSYILCGGVMENILESITCELDFVEQNKINAYIFRSQKR